jgi:hypothetical protein
MVLFMVGPFSRMALMKSGILRAGAGRIWRTGGQTVSKSCRESGIRDSGGPPNDYSLTRYPQNPAFLAKTAAFSLPCPLSLGCRARQRRLPAAWKPRSGNIRAVSGVHPSHAPRDATARHGVQTNQPIAPSAASSTARIGAERECLI